MVRELQLLASDQIPWLQESLRTLQGHAGGAAEFNGRRFAIKQIATPTDAARAAALAEVRAHGTATLDKHMQHCVVPLLAYADAGTEVRLLMAPPAASLAAIMERHTAASAEAVQAGGASKLEDWVCVMPS